jgi:hypothetical protein
VVCSARRYLAAKVIFRLPVGALPSIARRALAEAVSALHGVAGRVARAIAREDEVL